MAIAFRYKTVKRPDETAVKIPAIPLIFVGKENFETVALLDSGADISAMPKAVAEILGLKLDGGVTPAYGIGGKIDSIETHVEIIVEKGHEHYRFHIPIKVILGQYDFPILLGRAGFFDKFIITFDQHQEKITLKRVERK